MTEESIAGFAAQTVGKHNLSAVFCFVMSLFDFLFILLVNLFLKGLLIQDRSTINILDFNLI